MTHTSSTAKTPSSTAATDSVNKNVSATGSVDNKKGVPSGMVAKIIPKIINLEATQLEIAILNAILLDEDSREMGWILVSDSSCEDGNRAVLSEPMSMLSEYSKDYLLYRIVSVKELSSKVKKLVGPFIRSIRFHVGHCNIWFKYREEVIRNIQKKKERKERNKSTGPSSPTDPPTSRPIPVPSGTAACSGTAQVSVPSGILCAGTTEINAQVKGTPNADTNAPSSSPPTAGMEPTSKQTNVQDADPKKQDAKTNDKSNAAAAASAKEKRATLYTVTETGYQKAQEIGPTDLGQILCVLSDQSQPGWSEKEIRDAFVYTPEMVATYDMDPETVAQQARIVDKLPKLLGKCLNEGWIRIVHS
jgi:hypothetical protein